MASATARDARVVTAVRDGLRLLVSKGEAGAPGSVLFGPLHSRDWTRRMMRRLERRGLIRSFPGLREGTYGPANVTWYAALGGLSAAIASDTAVSQLLWPTALVSLTEPGEDEESEGGDSVTPPPTESASTGAVAEDITEMLANVPQEALLETAVKLCAMTLQNVVYLRERVDALAQEVSDLRKAWE